MRTDHSLVLRALSALLSYPQADLRAALPDIGAVVRTVSDVNATTRDELLALIDELSRSDPLDAEARFVDLFDRGRSTSLNLFEHVHGDGRERGAAMLDLRQRYLDAGLEPSGNELPDHLPVLLEYLSCRDVAEMRETLGDCAHILRAVGNRLLHRRSRYAGVFGALLELARVEGLDPHAPIPPPENLDATWEERPAFANDRAPPCRPSDFRR
ncbi:nitrate reductase molybdenum cofactor assembly chaperone [Dyella sp.]|uniref:nitrate reductase molybdenum cofactor assembly chaperone n=1 Tax=Dyella sp. TaxID=1869338 RepID=UPI002D7A0658|nr:nitrate reductase molybdenum cofactor assembly chaperone [Dyella sp.]HET7332697.1 nitrate reductase molybdenum cofactor assembly chaperone [Dyella sp.]